MEWDLSAAEPVSRPSRAAQEPPEVAAAAALPDQVIGDYVLVREIGHGGAGSVHRAWQRSLGRFVALKFLHEWDRVAVERLEREARMIGRLSHPNIVPLYDVGEHNGRRFLTMRLIEGRTLRGVHLPPARAAAIMRDVAEAVHCAHASGVIHRDLKPGNLMLDEGGRVWVMDFGLARTREGGSTLTMPGTVLGTPEYMAPEQAKLGRADERSDVYALGATLYELLTGRPPFEGGTALDILTKLITDDVVAPRTLRPRLHPELESIALKALDKDPNRRYASARAFGDDLRRHLEGEVPVARPVGRLTAATKWVRRHRAASAALAVTLATALLIASTATWYAVAVERARRATELKLAESLLAQGNAFGLSHRWHEARERYVQAAAAFARLDVRHPGPDLGLLDADLRAPPPLWTVAAHQGTVRAILFLHDDRRVVTVGSDGFAKIWDVVTGRLLRTIAAGGNLRAAAVSPDERTLALAGHTGEPLLFDLATGALSARLQRHAACVKSLAFSPDGRLLATGSDDGRLRVIDVATRREVQEVQGDDNDVRTVAFWPDGAIVSGGNDFHIREWDANARALRTKYEGHDNIVLKAVPSTDGRWLATGSYDRRARVFPRGGGPALQLGLHANAVSGVAFTPDGWGLLTASLDGTLRRWDLATRTATWQLAAHDEMIYALGVSGDGRVAMTGTDSGVVALWNVTQRLPTSLFAEVAPRAGTIGFSSRDRLVMIQAPLSEITVWDRLSGQMVRRVHHVIPHTARLAFDRTGHRALLSHYDGAIELLDLDDGRSLYIDRTGTATINSVTFTSTGDRYFTVGHDGRITARRTSDGAVLWSQATGRRNAWSVALSSDDAHVLTGLADGELVVWDSASGHEVRRIKASKSDLLAVNVSPDGRLAVTGGNDRIVRTWDLATGRLVREIKGHAGEVNEVGFAIGDRVLLSAGTDECLRAWDATTGQELHSYESPGAFRSISMSRTGELAGIASDDDKISLWDLALPARLRDLAARAGRARVALDRDPQNAEALAALGEWYATRGLADWAVDLLGRAAAQGARVDPLVVAANQWRAGRLSDAKRSYERLLAATAATDANAGYLRQCLAAVEAKLAESPVERPLNAR